MNHSHEAFLSRIFQNKTWKILIADDEQDVLDLTEMVLASFTFMNKPLEFLWATSGEDAKKIIEEHPDIAVAMLDVVMEGEDAGLQVIEYLRDEADNHHARIIIRTGQAGLVPEEEVMGKYDINGYQEKTEYTRGKMISSLTIALRAYRDIMTINYMRKNLEHEVRLRTEEIAEKNAQLERLNNELEQLARHDQLTGLFNRHVMDEELKKATAYSVRYQTSFSLILFDIDFFKNVNDTYGHDVGDLVLKKISQLLTARIRTSDILARWGGEEFLLLLPETNIKQAEEFAESLRQLIASLVIEKVGNISCSFGVSYVMPSDTPEVVTKRADKALYRAKEGGRNCVEVEQVSLAS